MNALKKESWVKVRAQGRDRFILRSIGRVAWICAVGSLIIQIGLMVFTKRHPDPIWESTVEWAFLSIGLGATSGLWLWDANEKQYHNLGEKSNEER